MLCEIRSLCGRQMSHAADPGGCSCFPSRKDFLFSFFLPPLRLFIFSFLLFVCVSGTFIRPRWETLSFHSVCSGGREAFLELVQSQELCSQIAVFLLVYLNAAHFNVVHLLCGAPNFDMASVVPDRALPRCTT